MLDVSNTAQVYVFCCAHAEQVKQHLRSAGWTHEDASMDVQVGRPFASLMISLKGCNLQLLLAACKAQMPSSPESVLAAP